MGTSTPVASTSNASGNTFCLTGSQTLSRSSSDANSQYIEFVKQRAGGTVVNNNDRLGQVLFEGYDGTNPIRGAEISAFVDGTPGTNDMPGRIVLLTTADGASSPTERLRIDSSGRVGIGTSSPAQRLHVSGSNAGAFQVTNADNSDAISLFVRGGNPINSTTDNAVLHVGQRSDVSIITTGRVGIGTTSVGNALHVYSTAATDAAQIQSSQNFSTLKFVSALNTNSVTIGSDGAGNAQIENKDTSKGIVFTTGGSEAARIDSSKRLLVGTSTARSNFFNGSSYAPRLQVEGVGSNGETMMSLTSGDTAFPFYLNFARQKSGSIGGNTAVANNDNVGIITFQGSDGSELVTAAQVFCEIDGTPGANDMPGRLVFSTTADGASSPTERMRITHRGSLQTVADSGLDVIYATTPSAAGTAVAIYRGLRSGTAGSPGSGTDVFYVFSNGTVQNATGTYTTISDAKLKENIVDANSQWDDLKNIKIRNWNFKEETGQETHRQLGPIAQELEEVCPGLVFEVPDKDKDGNELGTTTKGVMQSVLYMKAVKALQEAMERIEQLEAKVAALESA